eukprot:5527245-Pyramimonas_sp.AAC.1
MSDEHGKGGGLSTVVHAGASRGATDGDVQREISKQAGTVKGAFSFIDDDLCSALSIFGVREVAVAAGSLLLRGL